MNFSMVMGTNHLTRVLEGRGALEKLKTSGNAFKYKFSNSTWLPKCQTIDPEGRFKSLSDEENDYAFHSQRPDDQVLVVVATQQGVIPLLFQVGLHLLHVHLSIWSPWSLPSSSVVYMRC